MKYDDAISIAYQVLTDNWPLTYAACVVLSLCVLVWFKGAVVQAFNRHQAKKGFGYDLRNCNTPTGEPLEAEHQN